MRTKLIASHLLVIIIALVLLVVIAGAYLRRYEAEIERERLQDIAVPISLAARAAERSSANSGGHLAELDRLADRLGVRVLMFDRDGTVAYDTSTTDSLIGESVAVDLSDFEGFGTVSGGAEAPRAVAGEGGVSRAIAGGAGETGTVSGATGGSGAVAGEAGGVGATAGGADGAGKVTTVSVGGSGALSGQTITLADPNIQPDGFVVGLTSETGRRPWIARLTPRLLLVAAISLIAASIAGYLLSGRIARPIAELTRASNAIASGNLKQRVPGEGTDEIGQLVASFNAMSSRIAGTDQSQRQLLADVAHELRTPLTSVQGYAQALQDGVISNLEDQSKALTIIRSESDRMNRLIVQLLDLSRLELGQTALKLELVEVPGLIEDVCSRFEQDAMNRGITLSTSVQENLQIHGDRERLEQLLGNLVSNALRHTPAQGTVEIAARSSRTIGQEPGVTLSVRDSGEGIDPQTMPHLFERFRRGPSGGFGLGLSIVREISELHNATIGIQSQPGAGTTFEIVFPAGLEAPGYIH